MSIKIQECGGFPLSINCSCYTPTGEQIRDKRQYNQETQSYLCCDVININPVAVAISAGGCCFGITSTVEYLEYVNSLDVTDCDYSQYISGTGIFEKEKNLKNNHPDLYYSAVTNYKLYQANVCSPITSNTGTCYPLPTYGSKSISCANPGGVEYRPETVDYYIGYAGSDTSRSYPYPSYTVICAQKNAPKKQLTHEGNTVQINYTPFINPNGSQCTDSTCALPYEIGNVQNLGNNEPTFQSVKPSNDNTYLGVGIALLLIGLIGFGVLGYYIFIEDVRGEKYEFDKNGKKRIRKEFVNNRMNNTFEPVRVKRIQQ